MEDFASVVNSRNKRVCHFYWNHMIANGFSMPPKPSDTVDICSIINFQVALRMWSPEKTVSFVKTMKEAANRRLIPQDELDWISPKDERLCYWIWATCRLAAKSEEEWASGLELDFNQRDAHRPYIRYGLEPLPHTAKERYSFIIGFLDSSNASIDSKRALLREWRAKWDEVYSIEHFLKPNEKDEDYGAWLWNYITSNEKYPIEHWFIPEPKTPEQMFRAAVAAFDIWDKNPDRKKLFIVQMKKAWSQKKHRMAIAKKNKKSYNFTLTTSTKALLDEMADSSGFSRNEILERLIKLGHSKLNNKEDIW